MSDNDPSNNPPRSASSLVDLEEKLMFQQQSLDELNSVVLQQQAEIVRLAQELHRLRTTMQQLHEQGHGEDLPHEKPPHY